MSGPDNDPTTAPSAEKPASIQALGFQGNAQEYFRIWIVNLFLTIVTLGVYSAWAKVRKRKYFYRNTLLDGHSFDYHANPIAILKGRLIAFPLLAAYFASGYFFPGVDLLILLAFMAILPWLIVRSQMFNLANTSYRNIRFNFAREFKAIYGLFIKFGLLTVISFGLAYPIFDHRRRAFVINNTGFGKSKFNFWGKADELFFIYLKAGGLAFLLIFGLMTLTMLATVPFVGDQDITQDPESANLTLLTFLPTIVILLGYIPIIAYTKSRVTNYTVGNAGIEKSTLASRLKARDLSWIYFSNLIAIVFSVGLLIPWASVRLYQYHATNTGVAIADSMDSFIGRPADADSATGEEIADAFDFDVGI